MAEAARARRSQAERRDGTRGLILDATVECLTELGYARTSTLEVQRRAGVSRGALLHHYPAKAGLMVAGVRHLAVLRGLELRERAAALPQGGDRVEQVMDLLWETSSGDLFYVAMELRTAARTDEELRVVLAEEEVRLRREVLRLARELFGPELASRPRFDDALELSLFLMMGAAMTAVLHQRPARIDGLVDRWKDCFVSLLGRDDEHGAAAPGPRCSGTRTTGER